MKLKRETMTGRQRVEYILRRCALELHYLGEFTLLAEEMGVSDTTLWRWRRAGHMPMTKARWLQRRFGRDIAPVEHLTRRN